MKPDEQIRVKVVKSRNCMICDPSSMFYGQHEEIDISYEGEIYAIIVVENKPHFIIISDDGKFHEENISSCRVISRDKILNLKK